MALSTPSLMLMLLVVGNATAAMIADEDVQNGWKKGMATELQGVWIGDEKYVEDMIHYTYCSASIFEPNKNFNTCETIPVPTNCKRVGIDQKSGRLDGKLWRRMEGASDMGNFTKRMFHSLRDTYGYGLMPPQLWNEVVPGEHRKHADFFSKKMQIQQMKCLPKRLCNADVTQDHDKLDSKYKRWTVEAKSCGASLKEHMMNEDTYSCEVYQVNLLSRITKSGIKKYVVVVTLTYRYFYGGWDNYVCPKRPVFRVDDILADKNAEGGMRLVLQQSADKDLMDPCNWDCFADTEGICDTKL